MRFSELVNFLPTIPLERPFRLFGRSFALRMSSHLTLEPNTLLWVLIGETFEKITRTNGSDVFGVLRRGLIKEQRLTRTTLAPIRQQLRQLLPPDLPEDASLIELLEALPKATAWTMFKRGLGEFEGEGLSWLTQYMVSLEELQMEVVALRNAGLQEEAEARFVAQVGAPREFWGAHGIPDPSVHLPLDVLCQGLAAWEASHATAGVSLEGALSLLNPIKRPMGHWLRYQQTRAGSRSLQGLADRTQVADHERLRAWSAGRDLLPPAKAEAIVAALGGDDSGVEMARYRWARLMAFLCEWVICATPGQAPTWPVAQILVAQRYRGLLGSAVSERTDDSQLSSLPPP